MAETGFLMNLLGADLKYWLRGLDVAGVRSEWEKWSWAEQVRSLGMLVLCMMAWFARLLLVFLPQRMNLYGLTNALESFSQHDSSLSAGDGLDCHVDQVGVSTDGAMERALLQVLALVNDLPASSRKYAFARALGEKIIMENAEHGHGYGSINRAALSAGFKRTLTLLNNSLEGLYHQQHRGSSLWSLPIKVMRMLPTGGLALPLPPPLSLLCSRFRYLLSSPDSSRQSFTAEGAEMAEKLAQELLWVAGNLADCSALEEGILQWSSCSSLASLSLSATPRVQRSLVRLSALLAKELVSGDTEAPRDVKFKLLVLWLPLFCSATHGGDSLIFSPSEKVEAERTLEKAIRSLPQTDQEVILSIWLQEFAMSSSDWPNLQNCYDAWCRTTRKLGHQSRVEVLGNK